MKKPKKHSGVIVPMITPFTAARKIDRSAVERITDYLVTHQAAPFVLGTTGESASISETMRQDVVRNMVRTVAGRTLTYAGISSNSYETSINAAKDYFDIGVDVVVAHLPAYYPIDADDMLFYFEFLANNISGPLILYNITSVTHLSIPLNVIEKLSFHENIKGIKDSERDPERMKMSLKMWSDRPDFSFLIGWGTQMYFGLQHGGDGIVPSSGNVIPQLYFDLYKAILNGDNDTAIQLQKIADDISAIYQKDRPLGQSLAALKVMMGTMNLCQSYMLPPIRELQLEDQKRIIAAMDHYRSHFRIT